VSQGIGLDFRKLAEVLLGQVTFEVAVQFLVPAPQSKDLGPVDFKFKNRHHLDFLQFDP
jgi:hypothetical protein